MRLPLALALLAACGDNLDPSPPTRWQSEHFIYRAEVDRPAPGQADWFERHFALETARFGVAWPGGLRVDYRQLADASAITDICTINDYHAAACERDERVLTSLPFHSHELIHAYLEPVGFPHPVFAEGMAMVYGCSVDTLGGVIEPTADAASLFGGAFYSGDLLTTSTNYLRAASLTQFIIERYGLAGMLAVYRDLARDADPTEVDAVFHADLGASLATVLAAWVARGPIGSDSYCAWSEAGLFDELAAGSVTVIALDDTARVAHPDGFGAQRRLEIATPGTYRMSIASSVDLVGHLLRTAAPELSGLNPGPAVTSEALVDADAGSYWLDLFAYGRGDATIEWEPSVPVVAASCGSSAPIRLATGVATELVTWRARSTACDGSTCSGWVTLAASVATTVVVSPTDDGSTTGAGFTMHCDAACGACVAGATSQLSIPAGGEITARWQLEIDVADASPGTPIALSLSSLAE